MRNHSSITKEKNINEPTESSWRSYVRRWQWKIPLGLGVYLLAVLQWRYFRKRHEINKGPIEGLMVNENFMILSTRIFSLLHLFSFILVNY